jgi:peptide alpha-N-acetyltransferase
LAPAVEELATSRLAGRTIRVGVQYGKALKKLMAVDKHFADIMEDQFDFHSYCLRKMTLRAYLRMLRCVTVTATASHACLRCRLGRCVRACSLEDGLYGHEYFVSAAYGLVTAYLAIFDKPKQSAAAAQAEAEAALSDSERKKLESKRKKAALKVAHPPARLGPSAPRTLPPPRLHARAQT